MSKFDGLAPRLHRFSELVLVFLMRGPLKPMVPLWFPFKAIPKREYGSKDNTAVHPMRETLSRPDCVDTGVAYAERKAQREQEIGGNTSSSNPDPLIY